MKFSVYILYSISLDQFYIGQSEFLDDRIFRHVNSGSKSTKKAKDWVLKYTESFETRSLELRRELEIKKKKSHAHIEWLIKSVR